MPITTAVADVSALYLFPKLTEGPWDPTKPLKQWVDPNPVAAPDVLTPDGKPMCKYRSVRRGKAEYFSFFVAMSEAVVANVPPAGMTWAGDNKLIGEISIPCRELEPTEELGDTMGVIHVRNKALYADAQTAGDRSGFVNTDRQKLDALLIGLAAIRTKLGA